MAKKATTVLKKDRTVNVRTKTGGSYSYKFTTLGAIHEYLEETNQRYRASIAKVEGEDYLFIQKLKEKDGEWVPDGAPLQECKIPSVQGVQDYGGVLTTCRRYSLLMAYGLACEDDDNEKEQNRGMFSKTDSEAAQQEWKARFTAKADNPASQKQLDTIRIWGARAGLTLEETQSKVNQADNARRASDIIDELVALARKRDQ